MALKLIYYGQNDGSTTPNVTLTGDPGTDQPVLTAAGYLGGVIMALGTSSTITYGANSVVIVPCDASQAGTYSGLATGNTGSVPYGTLINGPGEFSGAIGPSG